MPTVDPVDRFARLGDGGWEDVRADPGTIAMEERRRNAIAPKSRAAPRNIRDRGRTLKRVDLCRPTKQSEPAEGVSAIRPEERSRGYLLWAEICR